MSSWQAFLERLARGEASGPSAAVLKHSTNRRVIRLASPYGRGEVVARWTRSSGVSSALDVIRGSAGRRDFRRILALFESGVGCARPLAYIDRGGESWLITEFLADAADLDRVVLMMLPTLEPERRAEVKRNLSAAIADFFASLVRGGWRHRDLKASNLLALNLERIVVVDWEGLRRRRLWNNAAVRTGILRLTASLVESPRLTLRDLARFLRDCRRRSLIRGDDPRNVLVQILDEARVYNRAAKRRKTDKLDGFGAG